MTKEKLIILAKTYPTVSKSYEVLLCMAGITEDGEWRRIYPVPLEAYQNIGKFPKRSWIEYELREEYADSRKESRKIYPESIKVLDREDEETARKMLKERVTTLEELWRRNKIDRTSLGVIKPILEEFKVKRRDKAEEWEKGLLGQQTLSGERAVKIELIDKWIGYHFKCNKKQCNGHKCMCEDIEVGNLHRKVKREYDDENVIYDKLKEKLFDWMKDRDLYFIMGTESHYGKWLIISFFYPKKAYVKPLTDFY